jgi:hypothetical protein
MDDPRRAEQLNGYPVPEEPPFEEMPPFEDDGYDQIPYDEEPFEPKPPLLPHNSIVAERALIGAIMHENEKLFDVQAIITKEDIYHHHHRVLWDCFEYLNGLRLPYDRVTMADAIRDKGWEKEFGSAPASYMVYLVRCWEEGVISANATAYAAEVKKLSDKRNHVYAANEYVAAAHSNMPAEELADLLAEKLDEITATTTVTGWFPKPLTWNALKASVKPVEYFCERIMTRGSPMVWGGPMKSMKTSTLCDFVVSLTTGTPFLGRFNVPTKRRVFFMSSESGESALVSLIERICRSRGLDADEVLGDNDWLRFQTSQPKMSDEAEMNRLGREIKKGQYDACFFDPTYLSLLAGGDGDTSPGNIMDMGPLYASIGGYCFKNGATPGLAFHANKINAQPGRTPLELHQLSYAGIAEWSGQWFLLRRAVAWRPGHNELVVTAGGRDDCRGLVFDLVIKEGNPYEPDGLIWEVQYQDHHDAPPEGGADQPVDDVEARRIAAAATRDEWAQRFLRAKAFLEINDPDGNGMTYRGLMEAIGVHARYREEFEMRINRREEFEQVMVRQRRGRGHREEDGIRLKGEYQRKFDDNEPS